VHEFYAACYPRLVRVLTLVCGDQAEAEEVAQDAFVRLLPRWDKVSRYEDPEAWLRLVAFRLLSNRRRRARNRLAALCRTGASPDVAPPTGEGIDVMRALATLPPEQRQVVVLHHLLDLPVEEVARVLRLPAGTVKSRLGRARQSLSPLPRLDVPGRG
jgi:RNA polymerase sigma-70 factor (ECF subfamily)